jgi:hypothetical protein
MLQLKHFAFLDLSALIIAKKLMSEKVVIPLAEY